MDHKDFYKQLIHRYVTNQATEDELEAFFALLDSADMNEELHGYLLQEAAKAEEVTIVPTHRKTLWPRIAIAASVLLLLSVGSYFVSHRPQQQPQVAVLKPGTFKNDVLPGNKAVLTLANGQKILVSESTYGTIAQQGSTNITKTANGNIVYNAGSTNNEVGYNTYTVPRGGGKHSLILADGTFAVLDAGSSIRYPTSFSGKNRRVEVTGQVYFEVVHNAAKPFFVIAKGQTIEDIGTHFNVNAFEDELGVKTTLLEGSIKVAGMLLKPGQQAIQNVNGKLSSLNNVNVQEVVAWKNDLFMFTNNTTLSTVMKQLSRWYDLEVVYEGTGKTHHFGGDMPRTSKLSDVLKILAYSGVQFSVDGKKIIVYQ